MFFISCFSFLDCKLQKVPFLAPEFNYLKSQLYFTGGYRRHWACFYNPNVQLDLIEISTLGDLSVSRADIFDLWTNVPFWNSEWRVLQSFFLIFSTLFRNLWCVKIRFSAYSPQPVIRKSSIHISLIAKNSLDWSKPFGLLLFRWSVIPFKVLNQWRCYCTEELTKTFSNSQES